MLQTKVLSEGGVYTARPPIHPKLQNLQNLQLIIFNNLRVFNGSLKSDSRRLHHT
jgi:hypothetical protein